jgi:hypothetical protein
MPTTSLEEERTQQRTCLRDLSLEPRSFYFYFSLISLQQASILSHHNSTLPITTMTDNQEYATETVLTHEYICYY